MALLGYTFIKILLPFVHMRGCGVDVCHVVAVHS